MPRSKTEDGRRNNLTVRLSDAELADAQSVIAGSGHTASEWLRRLVLAAISNGREPGTSRAPRPRALAPSRRAAPAAAGLARERARDQRADETPVAAPRRCPHPGTRVTGGYCSPCGVKVLPGGLLP